MKSVGMRCFATLYKKEQGLQSRKSALAHCIFVID